MSTEIAKSFTSKDLAETFPRQLASLEILYETTVSQSQEMAVPVADLDAAKSASTRPNVLPVTKEAELDPSYGDATGPIGHEDDPIIQLLDIMDIDSSDYSISYSGMIPPTGLVFGDPLPWSLPPDGIPFVDTKDIVDYTESPTYFKNQLAESSFLLDTQELESHTDTQELELQFPIEDIFPAVESFFV